MPEGLGIPIDPSTTHIWGPDWTPAVSMARGPPLTSGHNEADVLHSEYRQLFFGVYPDDPICQPVHGEDTPARGLIAVIRGPVRTVLSEYTEAMTSS